jgi:hypothetical protein
MHDASWLCTAAGTSPAGKQCAPPHAGEHGENVFGSRSGGPVYGHITPPSVAPSVAPASRPHTKSESVHAPVAMFVSGLMHGTQTSPVPHISCRKSDELGSPETFAMHLLKQTPASVLLMSTVVHDVGTYSLPFVMIGSGTHNPVAHVMN